MDYSRKSYPEGKKPKSMGESRQQKWVGKQQINDYGKEPNDPTKMTFDKLLDVNDSWNMAP